ncbi:hypothetical protein AB0B45_40370 [Nonomuraea sp. NPDC049152]|uniref:hypothetical protein n=1 Tax=Nonomuraea sp. NPDC049152 TaxID=3154350 RepID=UPI0033D15722
MPAPDVAALLVELERSEPEVADEARTAVEWLTGGEPLETVTQLDVCEFLWFTLPTKVDGDRESTATSLGRLLRLGGLDRYAALCDSPTTTEILRTYEREGEEAGNTAYHQELKATGVLPPDVPELQWSTIMGPEELGAHVACSAALELAMLTAADFDGQVGLTRRWLTEARSELGGDSWLHRVQGERLNRWVLGRGTARRELAQPFEVRLHAPVPAAPLPALQGLLVLAASEEGVPLRLPPSPEAIALRELAEHSLGAIRHFGTRLIITAEGRRLLGSPEHLWEAATALLLAQGDSDVTVSACEAALLLLASGDPLPWSRLCAKVSEVIGGEGWQPDDVAGTLATLLRHITALGLGVALDGSVRLTPVGQSAALAALRAHALRPRKYVSV